MPGMTKKLEKLLYHAEQLISNAQTNEEVAAAMAQYGYTPERWTEGQALLEAVKDRVRANEAAFAAQLGATDDYNQAFDEVWDQSQSLAQLCAALFEGETEALQLLGLHKRRDETTGESEIAWPGRVRRLSALLVWSRNLYDIARTTPDIGAMLADFGYPGERLQAEAAEVETLAELDRVQEMAKAKTHQSTFERDEAVEAFHTWLSRTEKVAKLALKGQPNLLELIDLRLPKR